MSDETTTEQERQRLARLDVIARALDSLIEERRRLRASHSEPALLEANRIAIVYWQDELARCVGEVRRRRHSRTSDRSPGVSRRRAGA